MWESASLEYPGRDDAPTPTDWNYPYGPGGVKGETVYSTWQIWVFMLGLLLSLGFGVPAAMMMQYYPAK